MTSGLPFDDIRALIAQLPAGDDIAAGRTRDAIERSRGHVSKFDPLEEMAIWLSRWSGKPPAIRRPMVAIFAGSHGVASHLFSEQEMAATAHQVERSGAGLLPLNRMCAAYELGLQVYDLALDIPTGDISIEAALDEKACAATMAFGMEAVAGGIDLLCIGAFGVGDDLVARTMVAALNHAAETDMPQRFATLPSENALASQMSIAALSLHRSHFRDPLEVLRRLGGRQFAALAGAILAARLQRVPVVLDGLAATASALVLARIRPDAVSHCVLAQVTPGEGPTRLTDFTGCQPVFGSHLSADEGVAAVFAASVLKGVANLAENRIPSPLR